MIEEDYEMDITYLCKWKEKEHNMEVRISEALYNCAVMWDLPCLLM